MSAHQAQFRIATMARVLGVSPSGTTRGVDVHPQLARSPMRT